MSESELEKPVRAVYRRPFEWGLIGVAAVMVIFLAKELGVLPERLNILGAEATFDKEDETVLIQNDEKLNFLLADVEKLKSEVEVLAASLNGKAKISPAQIRELPSDNSLVNKNFLEQETVRKGSGIIWLGEWSPTSGWADGTIESMSGVLPSPKSIRGNRVRLITDVNVREAYPERSSTYFRNVAVKGVASQGTYAKIVSDPAAYQRASGTQYWAQVQVDYRPKRTESVETASVTE
jgi:hypothetical protein